MAARKRVADFGIGQSEKKHAAYICTQQGTKHIR
jgi:hypothetical protein